MQPKENPDGVDDPFENIERFVEELNRLVDTQGFFCRSPMFRNGMDGLHMLRAMNAFLGMKSAELGKLIDKQIGPPQEWN